VATAGSADGCTGLLASPAVVMSPSHLRRCFRESLRTVYLCSSPVQPSLLCASLWRACLDELDDGGPAEGALALVTLSSLGAKLTSHPLGGSGLWI
jgi:hypothetical protein